MAGMGEGQGGWRCTIGQNWSRGDLLQVFLWKRLGLKTMLVRPCATGLEQVEVVETEQGPGPTFEIGADELGMLEAIGSAVHSMGLKGIQDERRAELEGELRATQGWLKDMRSLVFSGPERLFVPSGPPFKEEG